jgi:hypothetical protein
MVALARRKISKAEWMRYLHRVFDESFPSRNNRGPSRPQWVPRRRSALRAAAISFIYETLGNKHDETGGSQPPLLPLSFSDRQFNELVESLCAAAPIQEEEPRPHHKHGRGNARLPGELGYDASQARNFAPRRIPYVA